MNGKRNGKGKEYNDFFGNLIFVGDYLNGKKWNGKGKYENEIIYEFINGKGYMKYYNPYGMILFEGEYVNGKKHGKFKEYNKEYLIFEGEYLYDKKWTGKGFDENGNIIYEIFNGNGTIKEYNVHGNLSFEGEYLNGERNGKGKEYNDFCNNISFEGEYLNGKRNGKGKEYYN